MICTEKKIFSFDHWQLGKRNEEGREEGGGGRKGMSVLTISDNWRYGIFTEKADNRNYLHRKGIIMTICTEKVPS